MYPHEEEVSTSISYFLSIKLHTNFRHCLILDIRFGHFLFLWFKYFLHLVAIKYYSKTDTLHKNMTSNDNFCSYQSFAMISKYILAIYPSHLACRYTFHETRVVIWSHRIWETEFKNIVENSPRALSHQAQKQLLHKMFDDKNSN